MKLIRRDLQQILSGHAHLPLKIALRLREPGAHFARKERTDLKAAGVKFDDSD
jgi:hypothetical protein